MKKKRLLSIIITVLILANLTFVSMAAAPPANELLWDNVNSIYSLIEIMGVNSRALADIYGKANAVRIEATLTLYVLDGEDWVYADQSYKVANSDYLHIEVPFAALSGAHYKSILVVHVTSSDGSVESIQRARYANG